MIRTHTNYSQCSCYSLLTHRRHTFLPTTHTTPINYITANEKLLFYPISSVSIMTIFSEESSDISQSKFIKSHLEKNGATNLFDLDKVYSEVNDGKELHFDTALPVMTLDPHRFCRLRILRARGAQISLRKDYRRIIISFVPIRTTE